MFDEEEDKESAHDDEDTVLRGSVLSRYISRFRYGEPQSRTQRVSHKSRGQEFWWLDSDGEVASPRQADSSSDDNLGQIVGLAEEASVPQYQKQQKQNRLKQKTLLNQSKKRLYSKPPRYHSTNNSALVRSYSGWDSPEQDQFQFEQSETPERPFHEHSNKALNGEDLLAEWRRKKWNGLNDSSDNNNLISPTGMALDNERPASPTPSVELSHDSSCDPVISSEGIGSSTAGGSSTDDVSYKPNFTQFLNSTKKDSDVDKYNCGLPFSQYWKDNLDNDLLYQWRVKRRIQLAREQAQYKQGYQVSHPSNQARLHGIGTLHPGAGKGNLVEESLETHDHDANWSIQNCSGDLHTNLVQNSATVLAQTQEVKRQLQDANVQSKVNVEVQTYPDSNLPKVTTTQTIPIASPQLRQCNSCSKTVPAHVHMECDILPCKHCSRKSTSAVVALDPDKPVTLEPTEYRKYLVAEKPHHCLKPAVNPSVDQKQRQDSGKEKKTSRTDKKKGKCNRRPPHGPSAHLNGTPHGPSVGTSYASGEVLISTPHGSSEVLTTTTPHATGGGLTDTSQLTKTSESKLYKIPANKEKDYFIEDENIDSTDKNIPDLSLAPQQSSLEPQTMLEVKDHSRAVPLVPVPGSILSEDVHAPIPDLFDDMYNSDEADFPSDPLLQYLRKLRSHYQKRIRDVDRKLKNLHPQEMVQLEDPCTRNI
ncbi:uncharacterized protein LOC106881344 [Octopus bimaculoides]|uniref:Uncharacterized protein n=1 Tax=Octopus bimaculoides TaxID=37653 RepID=A0A0L8FSW7_OCTBM|nr:uncharacterized protein LOC106881344 [Octopus bimaculoides]XP_014787185.1 uncharacterized protein LOC106881344 [Octopus bimaculoides]|eukprot:XP_014787184.1 PREDICTED: uncharacterized protein LOC106881344 [Octopus bimaculoides]